MDTYECINCWGLVQYEPQKTPPEPEICSKCKRPKIESIPIMSSFERTAIFKCTICGKKYTGIESMYDTEPRPRVELKPYTGRIQHA